MVQQVIKIRGANQNNLRDIDVDIELNQLTVVTGVSGSGKSSLAFDTVYAEGQRRYIETFSSYARQFLDRMDRPEVRHIEGIPPAIAIDQTNPVRTSRSTVGTMTELNDHIKLLYARAGRLLCSGCGREVRRDSPEQVAQDLLNTFAGDTPCRVLFEVPVEASETVETVKDRLLRLGFSRFETVNAAGVNVVQDRLRLKPSSRSRLTEALASAFEHGRGRLQVKVIPEAGADEVTVRYSMDWHCAECDLHYREAVPNLFSFNSPVGACETCRGFGRVVGIDLGLVIPDGRRSLREGAVKPFQTDAYRECQDDLLRLARRRGIKVEVPWDRLSADERHWVVAGDGSWEDGDWYGINGFFAWLESKSYKMHIRVLLSRYRSYTTCEQCQGSRLKPEARLWRLGAGEGKTIHEVMQSPLRETSRFFDQLCFADTVDKALRPLLEEIRSRCRYLNEVGLGYLTLDRQSRTLSGGEVQRINLTTALGTTLVNTLMVLDEPSIGLHPRDTGRLMGVLRQLRDAGNTLLVVEHDADIMRSADRIIDMGPGAGPQGGSIVFHGHPRDLERSGDSLTGHYLRGTKSVREGLAWLPPPAPDDAWLEIIGATAHNLKNIDVRLPLSRLVCLTGVSGSGKSTLMETVLWRALLKHQGRPTEAPGEFRELRGAEAIGEVVFVDQRPIGRTTRSNPATYVGAWNAIRDCFAEQPLAKARGYKPGTFSFNAGLKCQTCGGNGFQHIEMQFLSDVYLRCPDCDGARFQAEVLDVKLPDENAGGKTVADVLAMTVDDAYAFFHRHPKVLAKLEPLRSAGLGYVTLGQPVTTLSGGEAQRLKLAAHLADTPETKGKPLLFLLDEPTTGLHFADSAVLLHALRALIVRGHSVVVIEHHPEVMLAADWIVDLGPEGGDEGGQIVCCGTPRDVAACDQGYTAHVLREIMGQAETPAKVAESAPSEPYPDVDRSPSRQHESHSIVLRHAREHNLCDVDVSIPRESFTVISGVSGSGKSTLAFDILYREGQRRYLESLNAYARQFVQPAGRPDVDAVMGLPPTVAIEQRISRGGLKSTVATVTEVYHYLRLLLVKQGQQYCPDCDLPISPQSPDQILADVQQRFSGRPLEVLAPLVNARKGVYTEMAQWAGRRGFQTLRVDGVAVEVAHWPRLDRYQEHTIELPLGTFRVIDAQRDSLRQALSQALSYGGGVCRVLARPSGKRRRGQKSDDDRLYSVARACSGCGRSFRDLDPRLFSFNSKLGQCPACFGTGLHLHDFDASKTGEETSFLPGEREGHDKVCPVCQGKRLNPEALAVRFRDLSIDAITAMTVQQALRWLRSLRWNARERQIAGSLQSELSARLAFMESIGLGYLTLDRAAPTLSGGEAQRIRLAAHLGSNLRGVAYVLDEPTIGLHPRDNANLLRTLRQLQAKGNTIVVVEHDEATLREADLLIDLGPGAGTQGGRVTAVGSPADVMAHPDSVTGRYLAQPAHKPLRETRRPCRAASTPHLTVRNATLHNLKNLTVDLPLGRMVCVTGVSGSGKSTLVRDVLLRSLQSMVSAKRRTARTRVFGCDAIEGHETLRRVLEVDQTPIGRTPRSCPATYIGLWDAIRAFFASTPEARLRGYGASRFSFNTGDGRCLACGGHGFQTLQMSFLPDVEVSCEVCQGRRFNEETCQVLFKGHSIADVLALSVDQAQVLFEAHPSIQRGLSLLQSVGLGYLTLGQRSPTLSGGEAQRIKLVSELARSQQHAHTLIVLDEPTVGLHSADVEKLMRVCHHLVDAGASLVFIEHNTDVMAESDWIIDLGPEGGEGGGRVVARGTPEQVASRKRSLTAPYLHAALADPAASLPL